MTRRFALLLAAGLTVSGPAFSQTVVKIGVLNDRSGTFADMTGEGSVIATRLAVADFKAMGHNMAIEIVAADHKNTPDIGSNIARQWYDLENVHVIVDVPQTPVTLAIAALTRQKNRVLLATASASPDLTGKQCSPNTVHWLYDTWMMANGTGRAVLERGGKSWFFLTSDYSFGHYLESETAAVVKSSGGTVVGGVRHPFVSQDFSSYLLQAQASKAQVVALANSGADTVNAIKQAAEFGLPKGGQTLAAMLIMITDVHSLGAQIAQGLLLAETFYWDFDDKTRGWSKRFGEQHKGKMPTQLHAGVYSAVLHYLKAVAAGANPADGAAVVRKMKEMPTDDPLFGAGAIRQDGRKQTPLHLFQVKAPAESKSEWDLYKHVGTIPGEQAIRPVGGCPGW